MKFEIEFSGHENIRSNHQKTIEITKESHLTPQGDCIIGINATSSCADLPDELKHKLKNPTSKILFSIHVGEHEFTVQGKGHPDLILTHSEDIVIRKSDFIREFVVRSLVLFHGKNSITLSSNVVEIYYKVSLRGLVSF